MSKLWLVAVHEYRVDVFKKSFILVLLSVPLFLAFNLIIIYVMAMSQENHAPVGYVDHSDLLRLPTVSSGQGSEEGLQFIPFSDGNQARLALEVKDIQAYFVLPASYPTNNQIDVYYYEQLDERAIPEFLERLRRELVSSQPAHVAARIITGDNLTIHTIQGNRVYPEGNPNLGHLLPLLLSLAFVGLLVLSSGYLMGSIFKEKENRAMEALMTSLTSNQLIWGKVLGSIAIGLTMFLAWIAVALIAIWIGQAWFEFPSFQNLQPDWGSLAQVVAVSIPSYVLAAALMFSVGVLAGNRQDSEQVGPLFFMAYFLPTFFAVGLVEDPNSSLAVILSLSPFTCVMAIGVRAMLIQIPAWQIAASVAIQVLAALGAFILARRAFHAGIFHYGRRLSLRKVLHHEMVDRRS